MQPAVFADDAIMQKDRDLSFDVFRGVAIIAVVAIHSMFNWGPSETGIWSLFSLVTYYRQSLTFAVPVFIFISGYWAAAKPMESLSDYKNFLIKRLLRILVPYFFWSFIIFGYEAIGTHDIDLRQIMFKLLTGRATLIYYFITVLAKLYIITPLLQALNRERYGALLIFMLGIITVLSTYISRLYFNYWVPLSSVYYSWVIFYEIGLLARGFDNKIFAARKMQIFIAFAAFACLLLAGLETSLISKHYAGYFAISPVKFSSTLYCVCVIFAFLCIKDRLNHPPKLLVALGHYSFGIYFIHMALLHPIADIIRRSSAIASFQPLYHLLVVAMTISICFVLIRIAHKLLPVSFCQKVLGF